jgi:chromate transport protein ChrA
MDGHFFIFFHSLLRYGVILTVAAAGLMHLQGLLFKRPILNGERMLAIIGMVLCHVQLVIGLILYATRFKYYDHTIPSGRFWKFEHIAMMVIAIVLITLGRSLSKRAKEERAKQLRVAIFYLIGLAIILWATPWPGSMYGILTGRHSWL